MAVMKSLYSVQSLFMQFYRVLKPLLFSLSVSEYLEVHQTELDKLTSLMKDMKRNSRLVRQDMTLSGFLHTIVYAESECCC